MRSPWTPARMLCAAGLALTGSAAFAQNYRTPGVLPVTASAPAPAPVAAAPAPAFSYEAPAVGCETGNCPVAGCAGGTCGATGRGNPASFAPNRPLHKNGCQPFCATKTYPHSDWHYIKHYCGPSLIPGSCYGHFNTTWRRWEEVCPGWQPNNDADCTNRGCSGAVGCQPGAGDYSMPLNAVPPQYAPAPQGGMNPAPVPAPAPAVPAPMPLPAPTPAPVPMPMPVPGLSFAPAPLPGNVVAVHAAPAAPVRPIADTAANRRVERSAILKDALAAPVLIAPAATDEIEIPVLAER